MLGGRLNTIHNLHYFHQLMAQMREAILNDSFPQFRQQFWAQRDREQ
jgi:queuine tRNA-ribosyltransferase